VPSNKLVSAKEKCQGVEHDERNQFEGFFRRNFVGDKGQQAANFGDVAHSG
jgi:hypothetical protein